MLSRTERIIFDISRVHTQMVDPGDPKKIEAGQKTIEIRISGRVQRVGMRNCIRTIAGKLNIRGEVMNQPDGTVRVVATADPILLEKFVSMIYGCPRAVIREIAISDYRLQQFSGFLVKRHETE
jgi:acylphosphatase